MFKKYQHIERFGADEVSGIELGQTWIFPKIDGTNGSVWIEDGVIKAGSRNRQLFVDDDNQGFYSYILNNENIANYLKINPTHRLFGEWLVPHSLKTYRETAWRKFYVFDVSEDGEIYLPYEHYSTILDEYGIDYIPPIATITNGSYEQFVNQLEKNVFLIQDGKGVGEGIVIKNYDYRNRFGHQKWAKIVRSEFKEVHTKMMGCSELKGTKMVEEEITEQYCTEALIEKTYEKIKNSNGGWSSRNIPQLLNTVYHDLIVEESWEIVKKYKNPTINFKTLSHFVTNKIKQIKQELF